MSSTASNVVDTLTPAGVVSTKTAVANAYAVAVDGNGTLYVSSGNSAGFLTPTGSLVTITTPNAVRGITVH